MIPFARQAFTASSATAAVPSASEGVMPVVWKRQYGEGRVFHSTLGHSVKEFEVPEMATILRRGINWAARAE